MAEPLHIRIRPDWDAALTYDSLDEGPDGRAVFVGRDTLIAPLVAEIGEPNKRGTYLISGYRGTGKTTLLIEALSRAQGQLTIKGHTLFRLVLNVSEVSASLGSTDSPDSERLDINPRRLLIALLRTIDHRLRRLRLSAPDDQELKLLAEKAQFAYEKATATKFSQTSSTSQESKLTRSLEFALALEDKNVLKTVGWLAGSAAVTLEAVALISPAFGWLHASALALAGVFGISLTAAYRRSRSDAQSNARQTAFEYDNSLQQLETDLKDILVSLKDYKLRTVVVIEELDKIDDDGERQLDAVIRYFKNLFTQAPALFFFVTDKRYFDIVASAIKRARRKRSYAVEHTFFTHRLFVGRPTTDESLKFISAIVLDDADRTRIAKVARTLGKPGRIDEADQFGRFVRCVLFYAANHLFDLKNELRRFVRNEEQELSDGSRTRVTSFLIDEQTLPPEAAALAVFQDLIVEKSRSFEIKGGRAYANETLADSLYAVFNELGSNQPQAVRSFLPFSNESPNEEGLLLDEQLDLSEVARIREAVGSLVGDLERGRAFLLRDTTNDTFNWRDDAARAFRYVRQLEKHEESLVVELQRHAALAKQLTDMVLPGPFPGGLGRELELRVAAVRDALEPMSADAAAEELRGVLDNYAMTLTSAFDELRMGLAPYAFMFEPVANALAGSLYFVKPTSGDPRLGAVSPRGGVLLAFGEFETLLDDVWAFIRPQTTVGPLDRAALVHVIHTTGNVAAEAESRREQWNQALAARSGSDPQFRYAVDVVAMVDPSRDPKLSCVQRIAASLAGFAAWARVDRRPYEPMPGETPPLGDALQKWIATDSGLFVIANPPGNMQFRYFTERDTLEKSGSVVMNLTYQIKTTSVFADIARGCMMSGDLIIAGAENWDRLGRWLLSEGRVIMYVDWFPGSPWTIADIVETLKADARVIYETQDALPIELQDFSPKIFPSPPPEPDPGAP